MPSDLLYTPEEADEKLGAAQRRADARWWLASMVRCAREPQCLRLLRRGRSRGLKKLLIGAVADRKIN